MADLKSDLDVLNFVMFIPARCFRWVFQAAPANVSTRLKAISTVANPIKGPLEVLKVISGFKRTKI